MSNSIVIYFSREGENIYKENIVETDKLTEKLARAIAKETGSDIFELEPVNPYPYDYESCNERVKNESVESTTILAKKYPDLDKYINIYLGFPIWYKTMPAIIRTFLAKSDILKKDIVLYPFCTNEENAFGYAEIQLMGYGIKCKNGLALRGYTVNELSDTELSEIVKKWLKREN